MAQAIDPSGPHKRYRLWLVVGGWMTAAVIEAVALDVSAAAPFEHGFPNLILSHTVLGLLVWQVWRAHAHLELWKRRPLRAVSVHATVGVGALAIWGAAEATFMRLRYGENFWQIVYADSWTLQLLVVVLLYTAAVGLGVIAQSFDREQLRQQREAELELVARDAELTAIKSQLQPHFLLNSLNSIPGARRARPDEGEGHARTVGLISAVSVRSSGRAARLLHRELDTVRDYLEIEQVRFEDRLRFTIEADGETEQVTVPPFLLQPLVENAVNMVFSRTRGRARCASPRIVRRRVHVAVSDTGSGPDASHVTTAGVST